jgi:hypothetical protein
MEAVHALPLDENAVGATVYFELVVLGCRPGIGRELIDYAFRALGLACQVVPLLACLLTPAAADTTRQID